MRRTTLGVLVVLSILAAACTTFTLVKPEKVTIGDYYTIDSPISWSRLTEGKTQIWTVDGPCCRNSASSSVWRTVRV